MNKLLYKFEDNGNIYAILKPTRKMKDEGDDFYVSQVNRYYKLGVLPRAVLASKFNENGGVLSEADREYYGKLILNYRDVADKILSLESKEEKTDEDVLEKQLLEDKKQGIQIDINNFEQNQISVFDNTAESKARDKTILWWVTQLSVKIKGEQTEKFFPGNTFEDRLDYYDELEDPETLKISTRLTRLITLWFLGLCPDEAAFLEQDQKLGQ